MLSSSIKVKRLHKAYRASQSGYCTCNSKSFRYSDI
ncbi:Uncharacterised protein [Vibrio cholerae]|nr:Uncharacterised protein [Vibrio cholerae]CSC25553.1 Uncharacterised protein [Vibrio cholerae]CSD31714.1 Uncharacterised protein [Vibrio cholerae]